MIPSDESSSKFNEEANEQCVITAGKDDRNDERKSTMSSSSRAASRHRLRSRRRLRHGRESERPVHSTVSSLNDQQHNGNRGQHQQPTADMADRLDNSTYSA